MGIHFTDSNFIDFYDYSLQLRHGKQCLKEYDPALRGATALAVFMASDSNEKSSDRPRSWYCDMRADQKA